MHNFFVTISYFTSPGILEQNENTDAANGRVHGSRLTEGMELAAQLGKCEMTKQTKIAAKKTMRQEDLRKLFNVDK